MPTIPDNIPDSNDYPSAENAEWSRRSFLKLLGMGALSTAWMFSSCRGPARKAIPYNKAPEWALPGSSVQYATSWPCPWGALPLMAIVHEGRPTMLEPNHEHPNVAGCPAHATASLWDLYSPDRSKQILFKGKAVQEGAPIGLEEFDASYKALAKKIANGSRVAVITENYDSPTLQYIITRLQSQNPNLILYRDDSFRTNHFDVALEQIYNAPVRAKLNYEQANCIVSLDRDFLGLEPMGASKEFFSKRNPDSPQSMSRLYVSEGILSLTGGMADRRLAISPDRTRRLVSLIAEGINKEIEFPPLADYCGKNIASLHEATEQLSPLSPEVTDWVNSCVRDLISNRGKALLLLGDQYEPDLHRSVLIINAALQAFGASSPLSIYSYPYATPPSWAELAKDIREGNSPEAIIWLSEGHPAPSQSNSEFFKAIRELDSYHLSLYPSTIARSFRWHIPLAHFLESWGDYLAPDSTLNVQQPVILPLYKGVSPLEFLLGLMGGKGTLVTTDTVKGNISPAYSAVKSLFIKRTQTQDKELTWNHTLTQGFHLSEFHVAPLPFPSVIPDYKSVVHKAPSYYPPDSDGVSSCLYLKADYSLWDGRFINNAWLQECPDPISKIVWGNAILSSPTTKNKLNTDFVLIKTTTSETKFPLSPIPGMADDLIVIPLGYGQKDTGIVGEQCGFAPPLLEGKQKWSIIQTSGNKALLPVFSQQEFDLPGNNVIQEAPIAISLQAPKGKEPRHQWGMCIDLSKCIGCNACVLACQAENNIPIVGREQAAKNRLMHWLHIDRYFREAEDGYVEMLVQPRACQQCENAPCESVCPLNATTHTQDGLNTMTYARCVGTRYCATNCPYKVRRFNYFDYNKYNPYFEGNLMKGTKGERIDETSLRLQRNPNVSVRMRGVMEKCTYCVQRIEAAKVKQKQSLEKIRQESGISSADITLEDKDLRVPPDSFQCACQAACPAGAITFGNLLDKEHSAVGVARRSPRAYTLLDHLNVFPRTAYLARIRNISNLSS